MNESQGITEFAQEQKVTSGDEEESPAFIPTTPDDHHQEALRKPRQEEFMKMTPWD